MIRLFQGKEGGKLIAINFKTVTHVQEQNNRISDELLMIKISFENNSWVLVGLADGELNDLMMEWCK